MQLRTHVKQRWQLGLILLLVGGLMSWNLYVDHNLIDTTERERLANQAKTVDENLQHQLKAVNNALILLQHELPDMREVANELQQTNHHLELLSSTMLGIRTLFIVNRQGIVVASNRTALVGLDLHERAYFKIAREDNNPTILHVSTPIKNALGTYAINLEMSTADSFGKFTGLVAATLDPDYFTTLLSSVNYAPDMWTSLVHSDGTLFLIVPNQHIEAGNKLDKSGSMFQRHMNSGQIATVLIGKTLASGEERMAARRTVRLSSVNADQPLVIAVTRNLSAIYSSWRKEALLQLVGFILLVVFTGIGLFYFQHRQLKYNQIKANQEQERIQYKTILKTAGDGIHIIDKSGVLIDANDAFLTMLGYDQTAVGKLKVTDWDAQDTWANLRQHIDTLIAHQGSEVFETLHRRSNGELLNVEINVTAIDLDGHVYLAAASRDITSRKKIEKTLRDNELFLAESQHIGHMGSWQYESSGKLVWSDETYRIFGVAPETFTPTVDTVLALIHPEDRTAMHQWINACANGECPPVLDFRIITPEGNSRVLKGFGELQRDAANKSPKSLIGIVQDITERKQLEEQLLQLAFYDTLTQLPNRRLLSERLNQAMLASKRSNHYGALIYLDLDNFKPLNDHYGHGMGDLLLMEVASRINRCIRETDTAARIGGDEFVVMLGELEMDKKESTDQAGIIAEKIRRALAQPYLLTGQNEHQVSSMVEHHCTASIGVVLFIGNEISQNELFTAADSAMYQAKEEGRNLIRFYKDKSTD